MRAEYFLWGRERGPEAKRSSPNWRRAACCRCHKEERACLSMLRCHGLYLQ